MKRGWMGLFKLVVLATVILSWLAGCQGGKAPSSVQQADGSAVPPTYSTVAASAPPTASPLLNVEARPLQPERTSTASPSKVTDAGDSQTEASISVECGKVAFGSGDGKTELPLYCLRVKRAVEDPGSPRPALAPKEPLAVQSYAVPSGMRGRLAAFWMNIGDDAHGVLLLAPKGWKAESADMGANGSIGIRLTDPQDSRQYVYYRDTGGCDGCAVIDTAQYFPKLASLAEEQGFVLGKGPDFSGRTELTPHLMAYSVKPAEKGLETNGVAYQNLDDRQGVPFKLVEVRLNNPSHDLATAILNLFAKLNRGTGE